MPFTAAGVRHAIGAPCPTAFTFPIALPPAPARPPSRLRLRRRARPSASSPLSASLFVPPVSARLSVPCAPCRACRKPVVCVPRALEADPAPQSGEEPNDWIVALEGLFLEAMATYYQGTPMFSDSEFETLRDELEHLGSAHVRLGAMEKIWVQATSARDFDRRVREEFEMSEEDLKMLKAKLLSGGLVKRPTAVVEEGVEEALRRKREEADKEREKDARKGKLKNLLPLPGRAFLNDAREIGASDRVDERIKWLLFSDASEERFKILLLYLPAVLMSFVTASVFTILFALLDGEMKITVTTAGRFRLGILSYVVVMLTVWFSNQVTPVMLDYLDLGQPSLLRGDCPMCASPVSCLFTGAARSRDERKCGMCGSVVGFNRKWSKVYLVSPPKARNVQEPD